MSWTRDPLDDRRAERERLLDLAEAHVDALAGELPLVAAAVAGSVARGDFNAWSDVDLVVVSDALSAEPAARHARLDRDRPGRLEVHGYTTAEFRAALERGDALVRETVTSGIVLRGMLPEG